MKKYLCITMLLFFATASFAQILNDNGPLIDPMYKNTRYVLNGGKWDKVSLTYYIDNVASSLTPSQRENIIQTKQHFKSGRLLLI